MRPRNVVILFPWETCFSFQRSFWGWFGATSAVTKIWLWARRSNGQHLPIVPQNAATAPVKTSLMRPSRGNMGKIFINDFSTFPSTLRRADWVNHTCSRGHFAHGLLFRDVPFKCWEIQIHARFRLLLPASHPQPLSSLLEFTILRYSFFESHHISTWEAGGG